MAVIEIYAVDAQPLQAFLASRLAILGAAVDFSLPVRQRAVCKFGGEENFIALASLLEPSIGTSWSATVREGDTMPGAILWMRGV